MDAPLSGCTTLEQHVMIRFLNTENDLERQKPTWKEGFQNNKKSFGKISGQNPR
jgi:hypothetical protein